ASQLLVGDPRLGIALVQGVIYALVVVLASQLAGRVFGESGRVWAAASVGLNPALGYYAAQALTEFLTGAVLLLLVACVAAGPRSREYWSRSPPISARSTSAWRSCSRSCCSGWGDDGRALRWRMAVCWSPRARWRWRPGLSVIRS